MSLTGSSAPAGFTKVGTSTLKAKNLAGKSQKLILDVYQKD